MLASVCVQGVWALALPVNSRYCTASIMALPILLSVLLVDWVVRQSLSAWMDILHPFAPLLALWFCLEAALLTSSRPRAWYVLLPGPWLALVYWQLQCLQSGMLPWPFLGQLFSVAGLMVLVMGFGQLIAHQGNYRQSAGVPLAVAQWALAWWLAADWPQRSTHLRFDVTEAWIAVAALVGMTLVGVLLEALRPAFGTEELK